MDPASPLQFIINAAAGSSDADTRRALIERVLQAEGRRGELLFCTPPRGRWRRTPRWSPSAATAR